LARGVDRVVFTLLRGYSCLDTAIEFTLHELLDARARRTPFPYSSIMREDVCSISASSALSEVFQLLHIMRHAFTAVLEVADEPDFPSRLLPEPDRGVVADANVPRCVDWHAGQYAVIADAPLQFRRGHLVGEVGTLYRRLECFLWRRWVLAAHVR